VFSVLSLKGKNQRNFKKTTIAKRQKDQKKREKHQNERAHFGASLSFLGWAPSVPQPKQISALATPFALHDSAKPIS